VCKCCDVAEGELSDRVVDTKRTYSLLICKSKFWKQLPQLFRSIYKKQKLLISNSIRSMKFLWYSMYRKHKGTSTFTEKLKAEHATTGASTRIPIDYNLCIFIGFIQLYDRLIIRF